MHDPDALEEAVIHAARKEVAAVRDINAKEIDLLVANQVDSTLHLCRRWFRHGEYLQVEIDTDMETCTLIPVGR